MSEPAMTRAERRLASRARILESARGLFAERGFERTTIRAVAAGAGVDPALVMQHFGSKRDLFTEAVAAPPDIGAVKDPDGVVDQLLTTLGVKLGGLPDGTLATLRSMLTDPAAAEHARTAMTRQIDGLAATLPSADEDDAELRAALAVTALVGITIGHQLLGLPALREVPADRVAALLRPALKALTDPPA
ncbi:MAG: TetR family transcriptional regulator [Streptomyces sp.]|nr:TetR family transcriptional regulator [Streptomyces sp.]